MENIDLINDFNLGDYGESIQPYFNTYLNFFNYAKKNGFLEELDVDQIEAKYCKPEDLEFLIDNGIELDYYNIPDEIKNIFLLIELEKRPEETLKFVCDNLVTDVYKKENGYYLYLGTDREELAGLFRDYSRETSPKDVAKAIFSEDFWEPYYDTTNDVYDDVINVLDEPNMNHLEYYIVKEIGNQELPLEDYDSEFFHELSEDQGTEGFFKITSENVSFLIKDSKAMNELLKKDLDELKSNLYSVHNNAYNTAYTNELYEDVWRELETFFDKNFETETKKGNGDRVVYVEYIRIKDFYQFVYDFLVEYQNSYYSESQLDYHGSYINCVKDLMENGVYEELDFRIIDYADWRDTQKYINEIFTDYVY